VSVRCNHRRGDTRPLGGSGSLFYPVPRYRDTTEVDDRPFTFHLTSGTELHARMTANKCEYWKQEGGYIEIHHVRKLADIKDGTEKWQRKMIERRRKTLALCVDCHMRLHAGKLPDYRMHLVER
jgi:hypothetical protein